LPLDKFTAEQKQLEAVVLYIDPKPALSNDFYSFLQPILGQTGSLILPFVYKSSTASSTSQDILDGMMLPANRLIVSNSRPDAIRRENVLEYLVSHNDIFSNGVVDFIVIYLEKEENRAGFVQSVDQAVKAQTADYLAMLVADTDYVRAEEEQDMRNKRSAEERDVEARDAGHYAQGKYWPRAIWEGLFAAILLLIILATGVWCTYELQTPSKWEKANAGGRMS